MLQPYTHTQHSRKVCCYRTEELPFGNAYSNNGSGSAAGRHLLCVEWADLVIEGQPKMVWLHIRPIGNDYPRPCVAPEHGWIVRWLDDGHVSIVAGPVLGTNARQEGSEHVVTFDPRPEVFDRLEWEMGACSRGETYFAIELEPHS